VSGLGSDAISEGAGSRVWGGRRSVRKIWAVYMKPAGDREAESNTGQVSRSFTAADRYPPADQRPLPFPLLHQSIHEALMKRQATAQLQLNLRWMRHTFKTAVADTPGIWRTWHIAFADNLAGQDGRPACHAALYAAGHPVILPPFCPSTDDLQAVDVKDWGVDVD
jgi:hypothetical protein